MASTAIALKKGEEEIKNVQANTRLAREQGRKTKAEANITEDRSEKAGFFGGIWKGINKWVDRLDDIESNSAKDYERMKMFEYHEKRSQQHIDRMRNKSDGPKQKGIRLPDVNQFRR